MDVPAYIYRSLPAVSSIRLFKIIFEDGTDDGQLETFSLDQAPPFATLSYTWGNPYSTPNYELDDVSQTEEIAQRYTPERNVPIFCNGAKIMVTRNLSEALQNIKERYAARGGSFDDTTYIWIDAICINQEDLLERAAQVSIMGKIYSLASRVFIWLGNSLPKTEKALALVQYLGSIPEDMYDEMRSFDPLLTDITYPSLGLEDISHDEWLLLVSFMERNWWKRIWVAQEYCLSSYTTVLCGSYRIQFAEIYKVSEMLWITNWNNALVDANKRIDMLAAAATYRQLLDSEAGPAEIVASDEYKAWCEAHERTSVWTPSYEIPLASGAFQIERLKELLWSTESSREEESIAKRYLSLSLSMVRGMQSSDLRDKIYALLSGLNDKLEKAGAEAIVPSYQPSNSALIVYTDLTMRMLQITESLFMLPLIGDIVFRGLSGLPSWVLDLSRPQYPTRLVAEDKFHASGDMRFELPTFTNGTYLHIRGYHLDDIIESTKTFEDWDSGQVHDWLRLAIQLINPYYTDEGPTEVLWRTLLANTDHIRRRYPALNECGKLFSNFLLARLTKLQPAEQYGRFDPETRRVCESLELIRKLKLYDSAGVMLELEVLDIFEWALYGGDGQGSMRTPEQGEILRSVGDGFGFQDLMGSTNSFRRLFLTEKKYLGLGHQSLEKNDEVWIFPGVGSPSILRRLENGHFILVGQAYVHGAMHGETVSAETEMESIILE